MARWAMVIDLRRCIGCKACVNTCRAAHANTWKRVIDCGIDGSPERQRLFLHLSCMHCSDAPCLSACPSGATRRRGDGIVDIDYDMCMGCCYCVVSCPYQARTLYDEERDFEVNELSRRSGVKFSGTALGGVCTKCNFCSDRIDEGLHRGLKPGVDPDSSPLCMLACSTGAISFGDLEDAESVVSLMIAQNETFRLQEAMGTGPSVYFIDYRDSGSLREPNW